jgi:hypothetical protein
MRSVMALAIVGVLQSSVSTLAQYYPPSYYYYPPPPPPPPPKHRVVTPVAPGSGPADWCANTRSAVALDRCARYRAGEPQPEQYYYKPGNNNQPPINRTLPKCTEADKPNWWYRAGVICQP